MKKKNFIIIIIAILLIFFGSALYLNKGKTKQQVDENTIIKKDNDELQYVDLDEYRNKYNNQDIVARLEIEDLFNIILVKGTDNSFYLSHSIEKKKDVKGTEFIDYRVTTNSKQINIYGHNSRSYDLPFRKIEKYLDKDFYNNHNTIILQDDDYLRYYNIFSFKQVDSDYEHMKVEYTGNQFIEHIKKLINNSLYQTDITYDKDSKILVIQTCTYGKEKTYYILSAILTREIKISSEKN